jgi:hypothetical protein
MAMGGGESLIMIRIAILTEPGVGASLMRQTSFAGGLGAGSAPSGEREGQGPLAYSTSTAVGHQCSLWPSLQNVYFRAAGIHRAVTGFCYSTCAGGSAAPGDKGGNTKVAWGSLHFLCVFHGFITCPDLHDLVS